MEGRRRLRREGDEVALDSSRLAYLEMGQEKEERVTKRSNANL